jgi:hypothetical protein
VAGPTVYLADGTSTLGIGKANKVTAGNLSRYLKTFDVGPITNTVFGHPSPSGCGFVRTGSVIAEARTITGTIVSEWATTEALRNLLDEANDDLPALFAPSRGPWTLRVDRTNDSGGATSRKLTVDTLTMPDVFTAERIYYGSGRGWIEWDFTLQASFPLWRDVTATTQTVLTVANSSGTATETKAWGAYTNPGMEACGLKIVITEITAGVVTSIDIGCTEAGLSGTWSDATFAVNDALDFFVADPQAVSWTSGNSITASTAIGLARGTNNGTVKGNGTSSPAFKCQLSFVPYYKGY